MNHCRLAGKPLIDSGRSLEKVKFQWSRWEWSWRGARAWLTDTGIRTIQRLDYRKSCWKATVVHGWLVLSSTRTASSLTVAIGILISMAPHHGGAAHAQWIGQEGIQTTTVMLDVRERERNEKRRKEREMLSINQRRDRERIWLVHKGFLVYLILI